MQESEMELLTLSSLLLLTLFLSLSLTILHHHNSKPKNKNTHSRSKPLPPGQTGWPLFGETLEFLSVGRHGNPKKFFDDRMAKHSADIFKTSLVGEKTAVFCGPSGNKFLFSNENKLVHSWWPRNVERVFPSSLLTSAKEESIKMRKLLPGFIKPDSLRNYVGVMDSIASEHLETHWECGGRENIVTVLPLVKKFTFAVACRLFLSIDDPVHIARFDKPFRVLAAGILSVPVDFPGTRFNRAIKAADSIRREILEIIGRRKSVPTAAVVDRCDILAHMLTTPDENGNLMSEMDIADKIIGLLFGGHDTVSVAITFIVKYLSELPHIYDKVLEEQRRVGDEKSGEMLRWEDMQKMKYTWHVACEAMRLVPPVQGSFREAITDFTNAGFYIPKGWKLYWNANTTHKHEEYFPEPEKFDPTRFDDENVSSIIPYTYVPFGGGPRMCPGKEYAKLEILVFVYNLVKKFKWEKVIPHEKTVVDPMPTPANGLPVRLHRHI
ncbi:hypothetical protein ABFS83_10G065400 [Erythranthe nasuta]